MASSQGRRPSREQTDLLKSVAGHEGSAGLLGRAEFVRNLAFIVATNRQVAKILRRRVSAANAEGAALRAVMLRYSRITPDLAQLFQRAIITGAINMPSSDSDGSAIASKILLPVLDKIRRKNSVEWGLTDSDAARVLREAPRAIRIGCKSEIERF